MFEYLSSSNQSFGQHYFIFNFFFFLGLLNVIKEFNYFKQLESVFPVWVTF